MTRDAALLALIGILPHYLAPEGTRLGAIRAQACEEAGRGGLWLDGTHREAYAREELLEILYPIAFPERVGGAA